MRQYPADGTTVQNIEDGAFYRFAGNAALPLSGCAGCAAVMVDNLHAPARGHRHAAMPHIAAAPAGRHLPHDGREHLPHRRRRRGAAHRLRAARRLQGRGHRRRGHDLALGGGRLLAVAQGRHRAARAAVQAHVGDPVGGKRRETFITGLGGIDVDDGAIDLIPIDAPPRPRRPRRRCSSR